MNEITIQIGDNLSLLKAYPDNHFDSIVTDAPYGLGKEPDPAKLIQDWIDHGYHEIKGSGFMGKSWDAFVPQPLFWKEAFRVLKPGGHLLCFFGTRTYDWGTLAIRLAGFEIRDMISWIYGSGFPKSLNISKAIDKVAGAEREVVGKYQPPNGKEWNLKQSEDDKGDHIGGTFTASGTRTLDITASATAEAKQWDGWGTALKPATEPICVARKPLIGTVTDTVLKYGTGGINIDACRIEFQDDKDLKSATFGRGTDIMGGNYVGAKHTSGKTNIEANPQGRFPANVIFDEFTADLLDEQSGVLKSGAMQKSYEYQNNGYSMGKPTGSTKHLCEASEGGASRFFYCAKASQEERNAGCDELNKKSSGSLNFRNPSASGRSEDAQSVADMGGITEPKQNFHPTVKPIALMRWLQKLVTPVGGLTLDPFAGSGTSGCSAALEGFNIVLMEMGEEYIPIIKARTSYWQEQAKKIKRQQQLEDSQQELF